MKRTITLLICVAVLTSIATAGFAQGLMGRSEISGAAAWVKVEDLNIALAAVSYGKFVTPNVEAQLGLMYGRLSGDGDSISAYALAPAVSYYFVSPSTTTVVPYIGVGYAFADVSEWDSINGWSIYAGAKFFLGGDYATAKNAAFVEYRYMDIEETNLNMVWAGLTTFF